MDQISIDNYEETQLGNDDFQFNCFHIRNYDTPPHWHNHTEIIYIRSGSCTMYINGIALLCGEEDIILVPHGSLHSIVENDCADYCAIVIGDSLFASMITDIHCNNILFPFFSDNPYNPIHISRRLRSHSVLSVPINTIITEEKNRKEGFKMIIKVELCRFFAELIREFPERSLEETVHQNITAQKMKKVIEYISIHFTEKISISLMAEYSHISNQHFCRLFKEFTGKTFIDFLTDYRLEQSNLLLKSTDLPITRIPELTGFCNGNYFSRVYKNKYGFPPSSARMN